MQEGKGIWRDEELVRECIAGNDEAWSALVDKYRNLIFSIPLKYRLSPDDAGEILQEVFLKLLSELPRLREPSTLPAWLIKVTSNECWHWNKKERRLGVVLAGSEVHEIAAVPDQDDSALEEVQREQALREVVAAQAARCKRLIEMLFFTSPAVPYERVAESLGVAKGSIGFIRMNCLKRLRRSLQDRGFR